MNTKFHRSRATPKPRPIIATRPVFSSEPIIRELDPALAALPSADAEAVDDDPVAEVPPVAVADVVVKD